MEQQINRLLMGCGGMAGLMLGTGDVIAAVALAGATICAVWLLRMQARTASQEG